MRIILALALALAIGGIGYYIGTQSAVRTEESTRSRADQSPSRPETATAPAPAESATPPATGITTPPAVETGPGAGPAPVPPTTRSANAATPSTGQVNEGVPPNAAPADPGPLADRKLGLPVANIPLRNIQDTFNAERGGGERQHEATDIMAPRGTPVLAVDNGLIKKLFTSKPGGLTIYQMDTAEKYIYYYAHLDSYAPGLREGLLVKKGDVIGYVGTTGNADPNAPHLHFAIFELGPEKTWYADLRPVNPYPLLIASAKREEARARKR